MTPKGSLLTFGSILCLSLAVAQARSISYTKVVPANPRKGNPEFIMGIIDDDYDLNENADQCLAKATKLGFSMNMLGDDVWFEHNDGSQEQRQLLNKLATAYFNERYGVDYVDDTDWDCDDAIAVSRAFLQAVFPDGPESYPAEFTG